ncbi:hypothetical protein PIB30_033930 [Stylosanthes scabra]|uniref:Uncharacterized protein n=1 Tax=Stylosanthes scabra TaxID=79078 RepID=A0ABU6YCW4_9FABA|nr:hypothetical protein [Stylosanthes scabra]
MDIVLSTIAAPGMQWDAYKPKSDRVDNRILTTHARGWLKMIVYNLQSLRHETTFSMETTLLLYTFMSDRRIHLGRILNKSMYQATSEGKEESPESGCPTSKSTTHSIHEPQDQPATSSAATAPLAPPEPCCTDLLKKILRKLRRRKKDLRSTQYIIRTTNLGLEFLDVIPVSSSNSADEDYV